MAADLLNILIYDHETVTGSSLENLLETGGYSVTSVNETGSLKNILESRVVDLVIFHFQTAFSIEHIDPVVDFLPLNHGIQVAVMAPVSDPLVYVESLRKGICHFINTPCSRKYLSKRISRILSPRGSGTTDAGNVAFRLRYRENEYSVDSSNKVFSEYYISLIENAVIMSREISEGYSGAGRSEGRITHDDILEEYDYFSQKDSRLEKELTGALKNSRFRLYFQPVISLDENRVAGFESSIRWDHEEKGIIKPDDFMPTLENSPLIIAAGFWVIEEAARQISEWKKDYPHLLPLSINVNLSVRQFMHSELDFEIERILQTHGVEPRDISFEITESAFMEDMDSANLMLLKLKNNEHCIYMDDFGTGYSSLSYLQHFPVDRLKIDKSFVQWMHIDDRAGLL